VAILAGNFKRRSDGEENGNPGRELRVGQDNEKKRKAVKRLSK
jgi:hypothetical protein